MWRGAGRAGASVIVTLVLLGQVLVFERWSCFASLAMAFSSVSVIANALRLCSVRL